MPIAPSFRAVRLWIIFAAALGGLLTSPGLAADLRETTALGLLPEDTAFYSASLRGGEQWARFAKSNFVKQLLALPAWKKAFEQGKEQVEEADNPQLQMARILLALPENQELVKLLGDACSQEVFFAGGKTWPGFLRLSREINKAQNEATLELIEPFDPNEDLEQRAAAPQRKILDAIVDHLDLVVVPDTLIGFRLTDAAPAERQLARLEALIRAQLEEKPEWNARLSREKIADGEYLVFRLHGKEIPWEQTQDEMRQLEGPQLDKLRKHLDGQSLVLAFGVQRGYLMLFVGGSTKPLETLGQGKLLVDRPELAPLRKQADSPLTSISYVSSELMQSANQIQDSFDNAVAMTARMAAVAELPEDLTKELSTDLKSWLDRVAKMIEYPQGMTGFTWMTPRGYEATTYQFGVGKQLDSSQPLGILDHVGGDPIFFGAGRAANPGEGITLLCDLAERYLHYGERIAALKLPEEEQEKFKKVREALQPLLTRLNTATREMLIPGLKDGQSALVIDSGIASPQWHPALPPSEKPLPLLEVAMVMGVTDAKLVRQAMDEYYAIARAAHQKVIELEPTAPEEFKAFSIPEPLVAETGAGTLAGYRFPAAWQVDKQLAFAAGLNDDVAVLSLSPATVRRVLAKSPLRVNSPLLAAERPLAAASHFNFAKFVDVFVPWIEYGIDQMPPLPKEEDAPAAEDADQKADPDAPPEEDFAPPPLVPGFTPPKVPSPAELKANLHTAVRFLKCYRGSTSIVYHEGDALVTRSEWHYQDLED